MKAPTALQIGIRQLDDNGVLMGYKAAKARLNVVKNTRAVGRGSLITKATIRVRAFEEEIEMRGL